MKKTLFALCALLLGTGALAQGKLGHIDRQELLLKHPGRPAAEEKIKKFKPRDYWEVEASFAAKAGEYTGKWFD